MYEAVVVVDNVVPAVVVNTCGVINGAAMLRYCHRESSTPLGIYACCCAGGLCELRCGT